MDADFQGLVDVQAAAIVDVGGEWDDADVAKPLRLETWLSPIAIPENHRLAYSVA